MTEYCSNRAGHHRRGLRRRSRLAVAAAKLWSGGAGARSGSQIYRSGNANLMMAGQGPGQRLPAALRKVCSVGGGTEARRHGHWDTRTRGTNV